MICLKKQVRTLEEYLEQLKLIETEIENEKKLQEELKKKKKLLEMLLETLRIKAKNCESRIEELDYKIKDNEKWMSNYNPARIKKLAKAAAKAIAASIIAGFGSVYGLAGLFNIGIFASAIAASMVMSYSVYVYFMSSYKRKASSNEFFKEQIEELKDEKDDLDRELIISDGLIKELDLDLIKSDEKLKSLEKDAGTIVKDWTIYNEKKIVNISKDLKNIDLEPDYDIKDIDKLEEISKVEAKVLKLVPKEVQKEMKDAA